jgi:hypothetical protein
LDWFAKPIQQFNFEGRSKIYTPPGVVCSIVLYIAMVALIADRSMQFYSRANAMITMHETYGQSELEEHGFNWTFNGFNMAFGMRNYVTQEFRHSE